MQIAVQKRSEARLDADVGREQLMALLEEGMQSDSFVLDIGCGTLRCGKWVIPLLEPGHYYGIDPVPERVEEGLRETLQPAMIELKHPRFDYTPAFDFSVFGVKFTHFVARSIWSHASKSQIEAMLDGVEQWGTPDAVLLASFRAAGPSAANDYVGTNWVGVSHESEQPGIVAHNVEWIRDACEKRGLYFELSKRGPVKKNGQVWAVVRKVGEDFETLRAYRNSHLAREIKHNLRSMKFAMLRLIDENALDA